MQRLLMASVALIALTPGAYALDVAANSKVTAATIYAQGALVTRTVRFSVPEGDNRVIIEDLPLNFDAASLRATGSGSAAFNIVSVDHRVDRLPPLPDDENPVRLRIEAEIEALEDQLRDGQFTIADHRAEIEVAEMRLKFIAALMTREPQTMVDDIAFQRAGIETWSQSITLLADQSTLAQGERNTARRKIDAVERAMADLHEDLVKKNEELAAAQTPPPPRSIATVELSSAAAVTGSLTLSYRVWEAAWEPIYDLRLSQGAAATLSIERHARVSQQTGEDWGGVALTLSTARPSQRMDAPDLPTQMARIYEHLERRERSADVALEATAPMSKTLSEVQSGYMNDARVEEEVMAGNQFAQIAMQGQTVIYNLDGVSDISGDGTVRQLAIDEGTSPVRLLARATPEFDPTAYLYAAVTNGFGGPILPGRAEVFRDGSFIGETYVPMVAAGKEAVLPFGQIDGIEVTRHVLEREDGDYGLIGTTNRRIERYELTATSVLSYPIVLTLYDRAPVTEQEDLKITVQAQPAPSEVDVDGKRGVRGWTFDLAPGAAKKITFGYDIRWPGDQGLMVE